MRGTTRFVSVATAISLLCLASAHAAKLQLAGPVATWVNLTVVTNSVRAEDVFSSADHSVSSTSEVVTCLALLPDWSAWRSSPGGTLDVWIEAVTDASNNVCVLLGEPATPELTFSCASDWAVTPARKFPPDEPASPRFGITTNRMHLVFYPHNGTGRGKVYVETQTPGGAWTSA